MMAHVSAPTRVPGFVPWLAAVVMWGGVVGALMIRVRRWRALSGAAALCGLAGVLAISIFGSAPARPTYSLVLASPLQPSVMSPVVVSACGRNADGSVTTVPGPGRYLTVFVDGRQAVETVQSAAQFAVPVGHHQLRVEVLTAGHQEYQPPLSVDLTITVTGTATPRIPASCPA
jgi:hypothetical protein